MNPHRHRTRAYVVILLAAAVAAAVIVVVLRLPASEPPQVARPNSTPATSAHDPNPVPAPESATDAVNGLLSGDRARMKAALSPVLAQHLPRNAPTRPPPGLRVRITRWQQAGPFAAATARLHAEGVTKDFHVGFREVGDRWRITRIGPVQP